MVIKDFKAPSPYDRRPQELSGDVRAIVRRNPMRLLVRAHCDACQHDWTAPAVSKCPSCHSERTRVLDVDACITVRA